MALRYVLLFVFLQLLLLNYKEKLNKNLLSRKQEKSGNSQKEMFSVSKTARTKSEWLSRVTRHIGGRICALLEKDILPEFASINQSLLNCKKSL